MTKSEHILMEQPINPDEWAEKHQEFLLPPICNLLVHKKQLMVMFVGGPNFLSSDVGFHMDQGSELFYQLRGNMRLVTLQQNKKKIVDIKEGEMFLLPSRVLHSPQRPEHNSLGLVIERQRYQPYEKDGLRFYTEFQECKDILWERYFFCHDLVRDLLPVFQDFAASDEYQTRIPGDCIVEDPPLKTDQDVIVPDPFNVQKWIDEHMDRLCLGEAIDLFEDHPDNEITALIVGGPHESSSDWKYETFFMQFVGSCTVKCNGKTREVTAGTCFVVEGPFSVEREEGSIGLLVQQDPLGNK
eukprot:GEMP01016118.1.p1 GENE.GEMP01016118.1~~GEMP01016118.1.p1  ORF type:complete len:299 (+),score=67.31 GEMP01016118.1:176-1072(+)